MTLSPASFSSIAAQLGVALPQPQSTTASDHLLCQHAQHLATTDLKLLDVGKEKDFQIAFLIHHLPEFAQYTNVSFAAGAIFWFVDLETLKTPREETLALKVAGCPVNLKEKNQTVTETLPTVFGFGPTVGPSYDFDLSKPISDVPLTFVLGAFPRSIGIRIHSWAFIDIVYATKRKLKQDVKTLRKEGGFPGQVFGKFFDLKVRSASETLPGTTFMSFEAGR
jgi:hypothetical protein